MGGLTSQRSTPNQQQARISASSATRELDELMESLSEFKVHGNVSAIRFLPFSEPINWNHEPDESICLIGHSCEFIYAAKVV